MKKALYITPLFGILFLLSSTISGYAVSARGAVRVGNRLYEEEKFDEALEEYKKAQGRIPDSEIVNFDVGTALYKKNDYLKSAESFTRSLTTEDRSLEASANYNIGNTKYRQGEFIESTDLEEAIALYREALDYYKRAIELDEKDEDAKFNYEFVKKRLEELLKEDKKQDKEKDEKDQQKKEEERKKNEQKKQEEQKKKEEEEEKEKQKDKQDEEKKSEEETKKEEQKKQDQQKKKEEEQKKREEEKKKEEQRKKEEEEKRKEEEERKKREEKKTKDEGGGDRGAEEESLGMPPAAGEQPMDELTEKEAKLLLEGHRQEEEAQRARRKTIRRATYRDVIKDW